MAVTNWWRLKTSNEENEVPERPRVYVRKNGSRYVNADEFLRSKRGRAVIDRMRRERGDVDLPPDVVQGLFSSCR